MAIDPHNYLLISSKDYDTISKTHVHHLWAMTNRPSEIYSLLFLFHEFDETHDYIIIALKPELYTYIEKCLIAFKNKEDLLKIYFQIKNETTCSIEYNEYTYV